MMIRCELGGMIRVQQKLFSLCAHCMSTQHGKSCKFKLELDVIRLLKKFYSLFEICDVHKSEFSLLYSRADKLKLVISVFKCC